MTSIEDLSHVLVVNDDGASTYLIRLHLDQLGCPNDAVADEASALSMMSTKAYKAILVNVKGEPDRKFCLVDFIRNSRLQDGRQRAKIIGITSLASLEDRQKCLQYGFDAYLDLPLNREDLAKKLLDERESTGTP